MGTSNKSYLYTLVIVATRDDEPSKLAVCNLFARSDEEAKKAAHEKAQESFPQSDGFSGYLIYAFQVIPLEALKRAMKMAGGALSVADNDSVLDADIISI
ncbi:MAG TPA: hypothetical protein VE732_01450 [Nitrososphaera sp.]|nr:hypothetical protein [Nitrososphaera sp.]